jgi:hypothetical protein
VIPRDYITEWRAEAPWIQDFQVEQDLVISRALVEIFSHPVLHEALAFRGGTALYKLGASRYYDHDGNAHFAPTHAAKSIRAVHRAGMEELSKQPVAIGDKKNGFR